MSCSSYIIGAISFESSLDKSLDFKACCSYLILYDSPSVSLRASSIVDLAPFSLIMISGFDKAESSLQSAWHYCIALRRLSKCSLLCLSKEGTSRLPSFCLSLSTFLRCVSSLSSMSPAYFNEESHCRSIYLSSFCEYWLNFPLLGT